MILYNESGIIGVFFRRLKLSKRTREASLQTYYKSAYTKTEKYNLWRSLKKLSFF